MPEILAVVCLVGGLFALIALMPDFQGGKSVDWDRQEDDD
jgi:hypothetical protein